MRARRTPSVHAHAQTRAVDLRYATILALAGATALAICAAATAAHAQDVRVYGEYGARGNYEDPRYRPPAPARRPAPPPQRNEVKRSYDGETYQERDPYEVPGHRGADTRNTATREPAPPRRALDVRREEPRDDYEGRGNRDRYDPETERPERPYQPPSLAEYFGFGASASHGEQYDKLEKALSRYQDIERDGGWPNVPADKTMARGNSYDCSRVRALERRLGAEGYLEARDTEPEVRDGQRQSEPQARGDGPRQASQCRYSDAMSDAVTKFQTDRGMKGDGEAGPATLRELNRPAGEIVQVIQTNMDRWRQVSVEDPGGQHIMVNIPFFELTVYEGTRAALTMPVIVGQPTWRTPEFSDSIEYIVLNPDWGIPESIASKEVWPKAKRDSGYFRREGIVQTSDGHLRQKPGPLNPLGKVKFMMPNEHNVYLHDTPGKKHFASSMRALSHGCIRVGKPVELAEYLLRNEPEWSPERIKSTIARGRMVHVNLTNTVPVHIVYTTARVNDDGRLEIRKDIYSQDHGLQVAKQEGPRPAAPATTRAVPPPRLPSASGEGGRDHTPADQPRAESVRSDPDRDLAPAWPWAETASEQTVR